MRVEKREIITVLNRLTERITLNKEEGLAFLNKAIEWSLYILIFSLPFSNTIIEITAVVAIVCWALKKFLLGRDHLRLVHTDLNLPIAAFYLISFLSIFWSTYPDISIKAFIRKLSEYLALYFIVAETVNDKRVVGNMIKALAASVSVACLDGVYQLLTGYDFIRIHKMASAGRMAGPFGFPNAFSAWLLIASFPFISLALFYRKNPKLRMAISLLALLSISSLFLAYTRGSFISFIFALILMLLLRGGRVYYTACAILVAVIAVLALAMPHTVKYIIGLSGLFTAPSSLHRLNMWTTAWRMFIDRPFLGQGLNTFMANYERFRIVDEVKGVWYAHNCYLQIAAETGIFGIISFLWMIARMVLVSLRSWRRIEDEFLRYLYLGLFCGIISFLVVSGVETTLYSLKLVVLFYFSLGLLMGVKGYVSRSDLDT